MTQTPFCSPDKPWGIHPAILDDLCPRCGWSARTPLALDTRDEDSSSCEQAHANR